MLTSLRKKIRPDNLKSDVRAGGRGLARRLYLASVVILLSFVFYYTVGGLFFLEAQGLALSDRTVVASLYNARVVTVPIRPGERVEKGTLLLTMQSPDLLVELGRHYTHRGDIIRRDSEINSRLAAISTLKPQAATRQAKAAAYESAASKLETQDADPAAGRHLRQRRRALACGGQSGSARSIPGPGRAHWRTPARDPRGITVRHCVLACRARL